MIQPAKTAELDVVKEEEEKLAETYQRRSSTERKPSMERKSSIERPQRRRSI